MAKKYRISVYNRTKQQRELMYEVYTSKKKAQAMCDAMNKADPDRAIGAHVITK